MKSWWKAMRKLKRKGARETQTLGGMPKLKKEDKVKVKIKWGCPTKAIIRANQKRKYDKIKKYKKYWKI